MTKLGIIASAQNYQAAADAVHFDGGQYQVLTSGGAPAGVTDSPFGLFSVWIKATDFFNRADGTDGSLFNSTTSFHIQLNGQSPDNTAQLILKTAANVQLLRARTNPLPTTWINLLMAWDTNHDVGEKIFQFYLSDAEYTDWAIAPQDLNGAGTCHYTNAGWSAGGGTDYPPGGPGPVGDIAYYYFAPGQYLDISVEANRRKFIDANGKPVDLGADGSTPTGTAPAIFFNGNAANWNTNLGTGGPFTLTGTLTDASTSPSD